MKMLLFVLILCVYIYLVS